MTYDEITQYFQTTSATELRKKLNEIGIECSRATIYNWQKNLPPIAQFKLEDKTGGALRANRSVPVLA